MAYINIAGTTPIDDPEYRYKMPKIQTKIEGRGNGIKTLVANCYDIATALHRSPGEITKFFGCELGAQSKYDDKNDRSIVNGSFDNAAMQSHLCKFIETFVLCPICRLPETKYKFKGQNIYHKCYACGAVEAIDMNNRLTTFILKEHAAAKRIKNKDGDKKSKKKTSGDKKQSTDDETHSNSSKEENKKLSHKVKKEKKHLGGHKKKDKASPTSANNERSKIFDDEENITWHTDLSSEAVAARKNEAKALEANALAAYNDNDNMANEIHKLSINNEDTASNNSNAIKSLQSFLKDNHSDAEIIEEIVKQQTYNLLPVNERLNTFFKAAFDENIIKSNEINQYESVLHDLVRDKESECQLISLAEELCYITYPSLISLFPVVLKLFYDSDIIQEDVLLNWKSLCKNHGCQNINKEQRERLLKSLEPFIDWLKNAEEESDEDNGDDE